MSSTNETHKTENNNNNNNNNNTIEWKGTVAGVASGITKLTVGHPFDTVKVRLQIEGLNGRFKGPFHCLWLTLRQEGLRGLYKGATPPLFGTFSFFSFPFFSFSFFSFFSFFSMSDGELIVGKF